MVACREAPTFDGSVEKRGGASALPAELQQARPTAQEAFGAAYDVVPVVVSGIDDRVQARRQGAGHFFGAMPSAVIFFRSVLRLMPRICAARS